MTDEQQDGDKKSDPPPKRKRAPLSGTTATPAKTAPSTEPVPPDVLPADPLTRADVTEIATNVVKDLVPGMVLDILSAWEPEPEPPVALLTDLPPLSARTRVTTLEPSFTSIYYPEGGPAGQFIANDNLGDGRMAIANGKYRMPFRSGVPATRGTPNGCQYAEKVYDGDPTSGWPLVTGPGPEHGLLRPWKAFVHADGDPTTYIGNIDTPDWVYNPNTGVYSFICGCHPGERPGGATGFIGVVLRWKSTSPGREPSNFTQPGPGEVIIAPSQHPEATWAQGFISEPGSVPFYEGGTIECSVVYEPDTDEMIVFFSGKTRAPESEPLQFNQARRFRVGRATCPAAIWDDAPVMTWTPLAGPDSYVWDPKRDGAGGAYGNTNGSSLWGTMQTPIQSHVSRAPDGVYHMVLLNKKPNTGSGIANASVGIGHYYSLDKGLTWTPDVGNAASGEEGGGIINWGTEGFVNLGAANNFNSPHMFFDASQKLGYLCYWANNLGVHNPEGTNLYIRSFPIAGVSNPVTQDFENEIVDAVADMATEIGKTISVTVKNPTYSRSAGSTSFAPESYTGVKLLGLSKVSSHYISQGLARDGDTQGLFAAKDLPFTVELGLRLIINGATWTVVHFEEIPAGNEIAAYKIFMRRA